MFSIPFIKSNKVTAIDIGHYAIKTVQLKKKKDSIQLLNYGREKLPSGTVKGGRISNGSLVIDTLTKLFDKLKISPHKAVLSVPNQNIVIRNITMPQMTEKELNEALKWEAEDYLPFSIDQANFDYIITDNEEEELDILLVAVQEKIVNEFVAPLSELSIRPLALNAQSLALISLLRFQGLIDRASAIIEIGASSTNVIIGDKDHIFLSRTINMGGMTFTEHLKQSGIDEIQAEKMKQDIDLNEMGDIVEDELDLALNQVAASNSNTDLYSVAADLASEISRSLSYYHHQYRGKELEEVFITGGAIQLKGLTNIIENEIDQDLNIVDPLAGLDVSDSSPLIYNDLSVAIGLALSEVISD